jgi:hypothetical protein
VVGDEIEKDSYASLSRLLDEFIYVLDGSKLGMDGYVVGDVVAPIFVRRLRDRVQPDPIDTKPREMVEPLDYPFDIAYPIVIGIAE